MPYDRTEYMKRGQMPANWQYNLAAAGMDTARELEDKRGESALRVEQERREGASGVAQINAGSASDVAQINAGFHKYSADTALEGVKYAADRKDPFEIDERAAGGPVAARRPYLVGERGPELIVPDHPGTVIPNHQLQNAVPRADGGRIQTGGEPMRRSERLLLLKLAAQRENTRIAHEGSNRKIDFEIQEGLRKHNLEAFNAQVDATYPPTLNAKTGKYEVNPAAEKFKGIYKSVAETDPKIASEYLGAAMKFSGLIDKYTTPEGIQAANSLFRSKKIDAEYYKRLISGDPKTVLDAETHFYKNPEAGNYHPGLLTGQPTPSGKPGLTAPGNPDSTPGIHTMPTGERIRVTVNPDGTRQEQLIGRPPNQAQLDKWQTEFAQTPEGQMTPGYFVGGDGQVYKANRDVTGDAVPTKVSAPVGPAPTAPVPAAPERSLTDAEVAGGVSGSNWTSPPPAPAAPKLTRPDVEEAGGLFGVPPNRVSPQQLQNLYNASAPNMNMPLNPPGAGVPARTITPEQAGENMVSGLERETPAPNMASLTRPFPNSWPVRPPTPTWEGSPTPEPVRRLEDIRPSAM